ncbi:MAG: L,D-transpeptidase [Ginsengibacter sp.]
MTSMKMKNITTHISLGIIFPLLFLSFIPVSQTVSEEISPSRKTQSRYHIVISKKTYELKVYDSEGWFATYPCVFGSNDLTDKLMEGDKRTPEGTYKVIYKKQKAKWAYELMLDYPTEANRKKFNERKAKGIIPQQARIGGGIAIHATRPQEEWTVDHFQNWTDGCISLKYNEARDLFSYIDVGTMVTITK